MQQQYERIKHSGIVLDLPPEEVPPEAWTSGLNVHFKDLATERSGGYDEYAEPLPDFPNQQPKFLMSLLTPSIAYWMYPTNDKIWVTDGLVHYDITPVGGITPDIPLGSWTGCILNGIPVLNNQYDPPVWWDGNTANPMQVLADWPTGYTCKSLRSYKFHLFAFNITDDQGQNFPELLRWSNGADPGSLPTSWTPAADNDSGDAQLSSTPGGIVDAERLRDSLIIYKDFSCYVGQYVAGQYVFSFRKLFLTDGIQSTNCVAEVHGQHYVFTGDDVIRHDGNQSESLVTWKIKKSLLGAIDPANKDACLVAARHTTDELWICIPEQGNELLTKAYIINLKTGDIGIRVLPQIAHVERGIVTADEADIAWDDDPQAWDQDTTAWDQATYSVTADSFLAADYENSRLLSIDTLDSNAGEDVVAFFVRTGMDLGDWTKQKFVNAVYPRITGETGETINIRVGYQNIFDEPITWSDQIPYVIGDDVYVPCQVTGRYISIRFESVGGKRWQLHKYTLKYSTEGIY